MCESICDFVFSELSNCSQNILIIYTHIVEEYQLQISIPQQGSTLLLTKVVTCKVMKSQIKEHPFKF